MCKIRDLFSCHNASRVCAWPSIYRLYRLFFTGCVLWSILGGSSLLLRTLPGSFVHHHSGCDDRGSLCQNYWIRLEEDTSSRLNSWQDKDYVHSVASRQGGRGDGGRNDGWVIALGVHRMSIWRWASDNNFGFKRQLWVEWGVGGVQPRSFFWVRPWHP